MDRAGRPGDNLVAEHINEQGDPNFNVGGVDREMPPELQLEQLLSYMEATYEDSENYLALLPDRITHAAMLMLGSAVDQTMPGVAFPGDVSVEESPFGAVFRPSLSTNHWCVSLRRLPATARDYAWRPEVAGAAELSGTTILDVDDPAQAADAVEYARQHADHVTVWAFGDAVEDVVEADATILTFPTKAADADFVQVGTKDEVGIRHGDAEYHSTHLIATPAESRRRIQDVAEFLRKR